MTTGSRDHIDARSLPMEMSPEDLASMRSEGKPHTVLDVREAWELDICKLVDCIHIPLNDLAQRIDELPTDRPLVLICHSGQRSLMATRFLREAGLAQSVNLIGGVDAWADRIDSSMRRY